MTKIVFNNTKCKLYLLVMIFISSAFNACVEEKDVVKEMYSVGELREDFDVFRAALEEAYPGIYHYKTKSFMDSLFTESKSSIVKQMTDREFMILLCKVVSQIGGGHLKVVPPKVRLDSLDEGSTAIPFQAFYSDNKLYVMRNFSTLNDKDFLGAQIISMNGRLISNFLEEFFSIFPSDGSNMTHKYRMLSSSRYLTRYFYILNGYSESYRVEYIPLGESVSKTATLKGLVFDELLDIREKRYPKLATELPAEFKSSEGYAYLRINTFDKERLEDKKIDFSKFLSASFQSLQSSHVDNLILDLRYNGGGTDEYGKMLFSYFINHDFDYYESLRIKKDTYAFFKYTNRPDMKAPKEMFKVNSEGSFDAIQHPNFGKQKPSMPTYSGSIYVLINGSCFSTTSEFLSMLHFHTKAIFIGEESGGGYYGNCSGPSPDLKLPHSKVRVEIPLMDYRMAVKDYPYIDRGLIPDHIIVNSIKETISGTDSELECAKGLIKNSKSN